MFYAEDKMQIKQEKLDYLTKALDDLWSDGGLNKAMATDLDIYILDNVPDTEPQWVNYTAPITPSVQTLSNLSGAVLLDTDFCDYLHKFLIVLLKTKQYELLYTFFDKAFVSHVCNVVYNSRNANKYSLMERSFDRFVEALKFSKIDNLEVLPALFDIINSFDGQLISRWQRPARDYLCEYTNQHEEQLLEFLESNFTEYGVLGLNFLASMDVLHSVDIAINFYLTRVADRQLIVPFLQQHNDTAIKAINKLLHNKEINNEQYVDLMLVFVKQQTLNNVFTEIFRTIADDRQKAKILEYIPIALEKRIKTLASFVKAVNHYKMVDEIVLGKRLSSYPTVLLASDDFAPVNTTQFLITQFHTLYSPKATFELSYFREFLSQKTLDNLSHNVYEQFVLHGTSDDEWAIALIASISSDQCLAEILMTTADLYDGEKGDIVKTLVNITTLSKADDIRSVLRNLDKHNLKYDKVISYILDSIQQNKIFSYQDFEQLADSLVPTFGFDSQLNATQVFGDTSVKFKIDENCQVVVECEQKSLDACDASTKEQIQDLKKRIEQELTKQTKRLESAFTNTRKWSSVDFDTNILKNPILYSLSRGLLWAEYSLDKVVDTFKVVDGQRQKVMNINNITVLNPMIALFHPIEAPEYSWKPVFEGKFTTFNQLDRQVFSLNNYSSMTSFVARFNGMIVNGLLFVQELKNKGWLEGQRQKPFGLVSMVKLNTTYNLFCEIEFAPNRLDDLTEITVKELRFYNLNNVKYQNNTWRADKVNARALKTLPPRYFSDIVYEISLACKK